MPGPDDAEPATRAAYGGPVNQKPDDEMAPPDYLSHATRISADMQEGAVDGPRLIAEIHRLRKEKTEAEAGEQEVADEADRLRAEVRAADKERDDAVAQLRELVSKRDEALAQEKRLREAMVEIEKWAGDRLPLGEWSHVYTIARAALAESAGG